MSNFDYGTTRYALQIGQMFKEKPEGGYYALRITDGKNEGYFDSLEEALDGYVSGGVCLRDMLPEIEAVRPYKIVC